MNGLRAMAIVVALAQPLTACSATTKRHVTSTPNVLATHSAPTDLGSAPVTISMPIASRDAALSAARDEKRFVVLRIEGISVVGQSDVYEVYAGLPRGARREAWAAYSIGNLAPYGAEGSENGKFVIELPIDRAIEQALRDGGSSIDFTFVPQGYANGHLRFRRLSISIRN